MVSKFFKNLIHILFDYKCTFKLKYSNYNVNVETQFQRADIK